VAVLATDWRYYQCPFSRRKQALMATDVFTADNDPHRRFYLYAAAAASGILFAGFAPTYFLKTFFDTPSLYPLLHFHGLLMTSWFVLFGVQTWLIESRRTRLHRRLGVFGAVLTLTILVVGSIVVGINARAGRVPPGAPIPVIVCLSFANLWVFSAFVATAVYFRRQGDIHKRLMLLATLQLLTAAIQRLPLDAISPNPLITVFGGLDLLVLTCLAYDTIVHRRLHPAFKWGAILTVIWPWLTIWFAGSGIWAQVTNRILS
jgi:hypothetical protein